MLEVKPYNRQHAYAYAARWAYERNPLLLRISVEDFMRNF